MSRILRQSRDLGLRVLGPYGTLHAYDDDERAALAGAVDQPLLSAVTESVLMAQGPQIYGGTDQIQHNIICERVLGLPREPNPYHDTPFRELPKNG
jgi:alkylation response protein AidB-like acyl-CoA dehydrogenase